MMRKGIFGAMVVLSTALSAPSFAQNAVTTWDALSQEAVQAGRPPASAEYLHALVHLAIWDAVVSIAGAGQPYLCVVRAERPASLDAAVAAAAHRVATTRVPAQAASLTASLDAFLAAIPDGPAKANGMAVGVAAADQLLAARANDGFDAVIAYQQPTPGPGVFEPVAPSEPIDVKLKQVRPLLPRAIDQFRPKGPEPLGSPGYARDFREVMRYGRADSAVRTPQQTETVQFWAENTFTQYARSLRELAISHGLDTVETSRLLAKVHLAMADTVLAGFEAKYHFLFWRPVHAIKRADTDGNRWTAPDTSWTPALVVNHPEYPSGHALFTSAATRAVARYFGSERMSWTISSTITGTARTYPSLRALRAEVADARVWAGLHFRHATIDGDLIGRQVERLAAHFLRPTHPHEDDPAQEGDDKDDNDDKDDKGDKDDD
jgi:hypothetical protein